MCRAAPTVVAAAAVVLAAGCSWVEMPSNKSLGPPASPATTSRSVTAAPNEPPGLTAAAVTAERQLAGASTVSASFAVLDSGTASYALSGHVIEQRSPWLASVRFTETSAGRSLALIAIVDNTTAYVKASTLVPDAAEAWIRMQSGRSDPIGQILVDLQGISPMGQAAAFMLCKNLRFVGDQTVDGILTSEYTGFFTPAAMRAQGGPQSRPIQGDVRFTVWVGPDHQIRRTLVAETVSGTRITVSYTIKWLNHRVHVAVPAASQVSSAPTGVLALT